MKLEIGKELSESDVVCRYFSFESFVNLLETEQLTFANVSIWEDPWENELANCETHIDAKGNPIKSLYSANQHFFVQCWTQKLESDAMWRIYSPNKTGVKVFTKIGKLNSLSGVDQLGVEKVVYFSHWTELPDLTKNDSSKYQTVKYKRVAFSHEEEVRFVTHPSFSSGEDFHNSTHVNLGINISDCILKIEIDPRASSWIENMIKLYVNRKDVSIPVEKSDLYQRNNQFKRTVQYIPVDNS